MASIFRVACEREIKRGRQRKDPGEERIRDGPAITVPPAAGAQPRRDQVGMPQELVHC